MTAQGCSIPSQAHRELSQALSTPPPRSHNWVRWGGRGCPTPLPTAPSRGVRGARHAGPATDFPVPDPWPGSLAVLRDLSGYLNPWATPGTSSKKGQLHSPGWIPAVEIILRGPVGLLEACWQVCHFWLWYNCNFCSAEGFTSTSVSTPCERSIWNMQWMKAPLIHGGSLGSILTFGCASGEGLPDPWEPQATGS